MARRGERRRDRSLRQQFIEHGFDEEHHSRHRGRTVGIGAPPHYRQSRLNGIDSYTRNPYRSVEALDNITSDWDILDATSPYEVFPSITSPRPQAPDAPMSNEFFNWLESPEAPRTQEEEAPTEPPATLDRGSPARARSRTASPNEDARAWLTEYESSTPHRSTSLFPFGLGRRRREDEAGPQSTIRRRLRHVESSGRDTRRDALVMQPPEGWLESMRLSSEIEARRQREDGTARWSVGDLGERTEGEGDEGGHDLVRTMSLSAVGRGDRPIAPLPRRRSSMLNAE